MGPVEMVPIVTMLSTGGEKRNLKAADQDIGHCKMGEFYLPLKII